MHGLVTAALASLTRPLPTLSLAAVLLMPAAGVLAQAPAQAPAAPVHFLDVPYIQQSEALCGGAAAAMVMRYWGAVGIRAESFAPLVDKAAGGIRAEDLLQGLSDRGWDARSFRGDRHVVAARLAARQPVITLIEDRPGSFHFVVIVAWANARVVYHDPARAPFRVVAEDTFETAWRKSDHWTLLALPPAGGVTTSPGNVESGSPAREDTSPCAALVAEGVRAAGEGNRPGALEILAAAADLCPAASGPLREAAGVHALESNWTDAARLARAAVDRDARDDHAWRILATSAYVAGDPTTALHAWNAAGEPTIDLITVQGLDHTRHAVAAGVLGLEVDTVLTTSALEAARRRLGELPSAESARVNYTPTGGGRANVDALIIERARFPWARGSLISIGLRMATDRELAASVSNLSGGGDRLTASWRWWENRPRTGFIYAAPSAMGIWTAEIFREEQTYAQAAAAAVEQRRGGSLSLSQWTNSLTRWQANAGIDVWEDRGRTARLGGAVDQRLLTDRLSLRAGAVVLAGAFRTWTASVGADWRSSVRSEGTTVSARAGYDVAGAGAPLALWSGAGTGHARGPLLRAHPLLESGRITGDVFGRRVYYGGSELRRWLTPVLKVVRIAPAAFVDFAGAGDRLREGRAWHTDAGAGLRIALPGSGVLRLDVAKGLNDGATAFSVGWTR